MRRWERDPRAAHEAASAGCDMHDYWMEFGKVALAHLLAVISPGPDFAIVVKQSITHGRRTAVWTSVGVGAGILLHVTYCLLGIALLIAGSETAFRIVKYSGALYLAWLGIQALRSKPKSGDPESVTEAPERPHARGAFMTGFLTNTIGNPKATLFFLALFTVAISPHTPRLIQAGYGVWMAIVTAAWFTFVSFAFTQDRVRRGFLRMGHWIDRALGIVFLTFAVSLALVSLK